MTSMENWHSRKWSQWWYDVHHMRIWQSTMFARSPRVFPIDPSPDWIVFWNYQITAMISDTTSLGVWQGNEENYLLWEMVDRNNRGFIIAGWLDNGHMPPLQVLDSTLLSWKVQNWGKLFHRAQICPIFARLICHNLLRVVRFFCYICIDPSCTSIKRGLKKMSCWILWEKNTTF